MPFDLSTAKPVASGGFDLSSAKPVVDVDAQNKPSIIASVGASLGKGLGDVALGAQSLVGKGLQKVGEAVTPDQQSLSGLVSGKKDRGLIQSAGDWLVDDAASGRAKLGAELAPYKEAHPTATSFGEVGGNLVGTAPVGGILAKGVRAAAPILARVGMSSPTLQSLANAVETSGFRTGAPAATTTGQRLADIAMRTTGGAVTGGTSAALVDPEHAGTGAIVGAALPGVTKVVGATARAAGRTIKGGEISPEVAALADRAKQLGIDIPADRIADSKPLNAVAAGLNYVPFSGRAATEQNMQNQLNRALSATFGQNSANVTAALRKAQNDLGGEFDRVLRSNTVRVDQPFLDALAQAESRASSELGSDGARVIKNQIDEIMDKVGSDGTIDGQAAYNIKRTLDRIGRRNTPEAYYASDLKRDLMGALNRSMTPEDAAAFATTRQQYGNMLALEKLAKNGVDGDISIARLANLKNINNKDLQELADISAQFLRPREGQHGAAQRATAAIVATVMGGPLAAAGGIAAGRVTNKALNSNTLKDLMTGQPVQNPLIQGAMSPNLLQHLYRSAPVGASD